MPPVHISLKQGKSRAHIRAVADGIHQALVDVCKAAPDDRFQLIHQRSFMVAAKAISLSVTCCFRGA
jgi:hypothetical protein